MDGYVVQNDVEDSLKMKDYIGEYLKKFFPERRPTIQHPIPKYIDIFFIFIEFNKYLARYFERRSKIDYTLGLDRISVSYRIKKKFVSFFFDEFPQSCFPPTFKLFCLYSSCIALPCIS